MTPFLYCFWAFASWDYLWFANLEQYHAVERVVVFFAFSAALAFDIAVLPIIWRKK